ncbi:MAG: HDOD domain-containing protein [Proteobacteria bacterium]|nr:HDOD domain-containing protein [Pseudomonadota bacterium]
MIEQPFPDTESWVEFYTQADLPILRHTQNELEKLHENAESISGRVISSAVLKDPLMTLKVLAYLEKHRPKTQRTDITTIGRAIMMIGIDPFFANFKDQPSVEDQLQAYPKAKLGLLKTINRARKAAHWAREWAMMRHDLDIDEITVATLLHDIPEILMWCFAPSMPSRVHEMQLRDRQLRTVTAQQEVYGIPLHELTLGLVSAWHLPKLLATLITAMPPDDEKLTVDKVSTDNPRVRNVSLAVDLARHSANGWDDPALPDDFKAIEELLHINHETLMRKLGLEDENKPKTSPDPAQPQ